MRESCDILFAIDHDKLESITIPKEIKIFSLIAQFNTQQNQCVDFCYYIYIYIANVSDNI